MSISARRIPLASPQPPVLQTLAVRRWQRQRRRVGAVAASGARRLQANVQTQIQGGKTQTQVPSSAAAPSACAVPRDHSGHVIGREVAGRHSIAAAPRASLGGDSDVRRPERPHSPAPADAGCNESGKPGDVIVVAVEMAAQLAPMLALTAGAAACW